MTITAANLACDSTQHNRRVCFSFAAYAKSVIKHLRSSCFPVSAGLSDPEFAAIEDAYRFVFPPDLRSILREGLPVGAGFPNWRSSSPHQLRLLLSLLVAGILNEISKSNLWPESFGVRPETAGDRVAKAKGLLSKAPVLVPIYRSFYIPSSSENGNPVFYVRGGCVRCSALDLADFLRRFRGKGEGEGEAEVPMPAWAAKSARGVETWSDLAGDVAEERRDAWRWREMGWRLREGGWREEEVREMMGTVEMGGDEGGDRVVLRDWDGVMWHVRLLALALLRAGWSSEDVAYCMGSTAEERERTREVMTCQVGPAGNEISIELV